MVLNFFRDRSPAVLLLILAIAVTIINTFYIGDATIYHPDVSDKRRSAHQAILDNVPPSGGWADHGANGTNTRIGAVYLAEYLSRAFGLDVLKVYKLIDVIFLTSTLFVNGCLLNRRLGAIPAVVGVLYLSAILPLTYQFHYFHPWDRLSFFLWILGIFACMEKRVILLAFAVCAGTVVKYDIVALPLLYILVWCSRSDRLGAIASGGAVFVAGIAIMIALGHLFPGGYSQASIVEVVVRNISNIIHENLRYPPVLALGIPLILAIVGWKSGDRFARAAFVMAFIVAAPLFALTRFEEVRAEVMLVFLLSPLALIGLQKLAGPTTEHRLSGR